MVMYQLVEFKTYHGRVNYWAIKEVIYNEMGEPCEIKSPGYVSREMHAESVSNPRIYADQHDFEDKP